MSNLSQTAIEQSLDRIARHNPALHAFVTVVPEHARALARHEDALTALGRPPGLLAGLVVAIKDIIDVAGLPTGGGSFTRDGAAPAARDALVVQRLRAAGAVVAGKTHTVEYAFGGWGTNVSKGTPHNPWDMQNHRVPGGSSSGSGVAVGAGLVPAALGTDTGGSIRIPASFCGIVGLKTTAGLLSNEGVLPLSTRFDTVGPMTRTVADAAKMLAALAGEGAHRMMGGAAFAADPLAPLSRGIAGLRVGMLNIDGIALHPDTARVFTATQALLQKLGATLVPVSLPRPMPAYLGALGQWIAADGYRVYGDLVDAEPNRLGAPVRGRMLTGQHVSAAWLVAEQERQAADIAATAELFTSVDCLLTPASAFPAPTVAEHDEDTSPATFTRFVNYLDLAGIALPMGLSGEGLPVGMQIVVPGFCEVRALRIAAALEAARGMAIEVAFT